MASIPEQPTPLLQASAPARRVEPMTQPRLPSRAGGAAPRYLTFSSFKPGAYSNAWHIVGPQCFCPKNYWANLFNRQPVRQVPTQWAQRQAGP